MHFLKPRYLLALAPCLLVGCGIELSEPGASDSSFSSEVEISALPNINDRFVGQIETSRAPISISLDSFTSQHEYQTYESHVEDGAADEYASFSTVHIDGAVLPATGLVTRCDSVALVSQKACAYSESDTFIYQKISLSPSTQPRSRWETYKGEYLRVVHTLVPQIDDNSAVTGSLRIGLKKDWSDSYSGKIYFTYYSATKGSLESIYIGDLRVASTHYSNRNFVKYRSDSVLVKDGFVFSFVEDGERESLTWEFYAE